MKIFVAFFIIYNSLYAVKGIYMMENETEHAYATDSTSLDSEYYALINTTNRDPVTFLQKMDAHLVNQITQPVKNNSLTISYSINEYNKVLNDILTELLGKSVHQQQAIIPVAEIVCKTLRPKFITSLINYDSMRNIFEWDDIDIQVFYSLIQTTEELWREMTQAYKVVRARKDKKIKQTNRTECSFINMTMRPYNQTRNGRT